MKHFFYNNRRPIFTTKSGLSLTRNEAASLLHQTNISGKVIDCWATILNRDQRLLGKGQTSRYYLPTKILVSTIKFFK